jgi:Xaa-Pro aminopeptidase
MYANPARASLIRKLRDKSPDLDILDLSEHFKTMRFVKQPSEIAAIKKSVDITCRAINSARRHHYEYEYEAEADISRSFRRDGAAGHAYDPIVASGINACVLHYQENSSKIEEGALILADVGASYNHYGADITRTWSQNKATPRQQAVISAVNDAVEFSLEPLKPGVIYADVISDLRSFVGEKLRELGLIKTISEEEVFRYYPHSPHFLGLATHDVGDYHAPLVPGVVLTVEPGIYIKEEGIGVRIEEDVLITDNGYELLSAKLPRIF